MAGEEEKEVDEGEECVTTGGRTHLGPRIAVRYAGESLREFLRLLSDFADTFGALGGCWAAERARLECHTKERSGRASGRDSPFVKLLVKSRPIWALMARAYGQLN